MPALLRHAAATARGLVLKSQRYPADAEERVAEILERDQWSAAQWKRYQEERLAYILHRAATRVPFYRQGWEERRRRGDRAAWDILANWPILSKEHVRRYGHALIDETLDTRGLLTDTTGGTTGTPLRIWLSREVQYQSYALFEARVRRWNGVSRHEHWGTMGGQQIIAIDAKRPPYWVYNLSLNQVYLSTNHISSRTAPAYIDVIRRFRATHLVVYTSSLAYLADQAVRAGLQPPHDLRIVITNAEGLFPWQREVIRKGLGCESRETYGMVELVACASEYNGELLVWPEMGKIEVFQDDVDTPAGSGVAGRFICTGLLNADMPLIRFEVGDRGVIDSAPDVAASFSYSRISRLEGRMIDMLMTRDGKQVWYFNPVFTGMPIREAQVVQERLDQVQMIYVPGVGFDEAAKLTMKKRIQHRLGDVDVLFREVERVPREPNGKFRPVVCRLSPEQRRAAGEIR